MVIMDGEYISAVPGSGKTETLINKCYDLMNEHEVEEVVAITFTDRAASELMDRLKRRAIEERKMDLVKELPASNVGTIHNFCSKIVRKYGSEIGLHWNFRVIDELESIGLLEGTIRRYIIAIRNEKTSEEGALVDNMIERFGVDAEQIVNECTRILGSHKGYFEYMAMTNGSFFTSYQKAIYDKEVMKEISSHTKISMIPELVSLIHFIVGEYQQVKLQRRLMDFDDLLLYTLKILEDKGEELASKFKFILVDEFQDTDHLQISIFEQFMKNGTSFFIVGDLNQSIYSFRGAHQAAQKRFSSYISNQVSLKINKRSSKNLIAFYNKFFTKAIESEEMGSYSNEDGGAYCYMAEDSDESIKTVSEIIKKKIRNGEKGGDIAVLSRISSDFFNIKSHLRDQGVESVLISGESLLKSQEGLDILSLIRFLADPSDRISEAAILFSPLFGMNVSEVMRSSNNMLEILLERLGSYRDHLKKERIDFVINRILAREGYFSSLLSSPRGVERMERTSRILELLSSHVMRYGGDLPSLIDWWENSLDSKESGPIDDLLRDETRVKIMTIHQAKGLEFNTVIIYDLDPGRNRERFYSDEYCGLVIKNDSDFMNSPSRKIISKSEMYSFSLSEELRILYVAFTRAKRDLHIVLSKRELKDERMAQKSDTLLSMFQKTSGIFKGGTDEEKEERMIAMGMTPSKVEETEPFPREEFIQKVVGRRESSKREEDVEDDEENLQAIKRFLAERGDAIKHLRISEAGSTVTISNDGLRVYEFKPISNNYFVSKGKIIFQI